MVAGGPKDRPDPAALAAATLKPLRRRRGVSSAQLAHQLEISQRALEHVESGKTPLTIERVHEIAEFLHADPYALFAAFEIGSPKFAVRCADNKLMLIMMMKLREFDAKAQDTIALLDPLTLISAFEALFEGLAEKARAQERIVGGWKDPNADSLS